MNLLRNTVFIPAALLTVLHAHDANADVVEYNTEDRDQWFADVGGPENVSTVDFTGFDDFTPVDDQWAHLGVHFSGFVVTSGFDDIAFPNDGWGLRGEPDINMTFDQPMQWIAADFPGDTVIELFSNDALIYKSSLLGSGGTGFFGGLVSDQPFDRARFSTPLAHMESIDDLHFGPPIPVPGAVGALAPFALLLAGGSRRRGSFIACD